MTAVTREKQELMREIEARVIASFDRDPGAQRSLFVGILRLALSKYTMRDLRGWLAILNLSAALTRSIGPEG